MKTVMIPSTAQYAHRHTHSFHSLQDVTVCAFKTDRTVFVSKREKEGEVGKMRKEMGQRTLMKTVIIYM